MLREADLTHPVAVAQPSREVLDGLLEDTAPAVGVDDLTGGEEGGEEGRGEHDVASA